jgi:hypothetical protein
MAGFILYKRVPKAQILKDAKKAKVDIAAWFKNNPKRKVCNAEFWYGKRVKIKPNSIDADVDAAAQAAIDNK